MNATTASVSPSSSKSSSACANAFVPSTPAIPARKTIASSGSEREWSSSSRSAANTSAGRRRTSSVRSHHNRSTRGSLGGEADRLVDARQPVGHVERQLIALHLDLERDQPADEQVRPIRNEERCAR